MRQNRINELQTGGGIRDRYPEHFRQSPPPIRKTSDPAPISRTPSPAATRSNTASPAGALVALGITAAAAFCAYKLLKGKKAAPEATPSEATEPDPPEAPAA
jgi:hypothetical protein